MLSRRGAGAGETVVVEVLQDHEVPALAALFARAFWANPAYGAIFEDQGARRRDAMEWLFARRVRAYAAQGNTFLVARDSASGTLCGAVGIAAPTKRPGLWAMIKHGMGVWACTWGVGSLIRALQLDAQLSKGLVARDDDPTPSSPPWELLMMAVDPAWQGKGIGAMLLGRILSVVPENSSRIVLTTQDERAQAMYTKAGFKLDEEVLVHVGKAPFRTWIMSSKNGG